MEQINKGIKRRYQFKDLIGNVGTINLIKNSLKNNTFPNFVILSGLPGTGKSSSAEISALYLTCEHPNEKGEPCLTCSSCLNNLKALQTTGESTTLKKINLGMKSSETNINEIIKNIFKLQHVGNVVYILEEAHSLTKQEQTALLEEIDRNKGAYVIMVTTRPYALLEELRSRATSFNFGRLKKPEAKLLLDRLCEEGNYNFTTHIKDLIIANAKSVPRDIVKLATFISNNDFSSIDVEEFLGYIDHRTFESILRICYKDLYSLDSYIESLLSEHTPDTLLVKFKEYMVNAVLKSEGGVTDALGTGRKDLELFKELGFSKMYHISLIIDQYKPNEIGETDFKLMVLKIRQVIQEVSLKDVVVNKRKEGVVQGMESIKSFREQKQVNRMINNATQPQSSKLTKDSLKNL